MGLSHTAPCDGACMTSAPTDTVSDAAADRAAPDSGDAAYHVLARKYRPQTFDDLIGQDAMVRTLSNAFASGRVAHGFILTGVRGVGKTTTARIIAKGLNCIGVDGRGGPTVKPCGVCEPCQSIAESRNVDVLEMDAASRTGIGDIREIIDSVRYRPASCRFKVYIIDEVHMLSNAAFNGLLKTLEEPPPHVKFIFATTEIRKVPVTVLSRCQRFDLRRIPPEVMTAYLDGIAKAEGAEGDAEALALIARASEGSARDAVSLLDQAIAHGRAQDDGRVAITAEAVRDMLGLADRGRVIDLFEMVMKADIAGGLAELRDQYDTGADPLMVLGDLLDVVHWLTRLTVVPAAGEDPATPPADRERGASLAKELPINVLTRAWQILLKGLGEAAQAPNPLAAAEMVLIRLGYAATLKTPDDVLRLLEGAPPSPQPTGPGGAAPGGSGGGAVSAQAGAGVAPAMPHGAPTALAARVVEGGLASQPQITPQSTPEITPQALPDPERVIEARVRDTVIPLRQFEDLVTAAQEARQVRFEMALRAGVHPVRFSAGRMDFRPSDEAPADLVQQIQAHLKDWTGERWIVSVVNDPGAPTMRERENAARVEERKALLAHPLVAAALAAFPGGELGRVRTLADEAAEAEADVPPDLGADDDDDDEF